MNFQTIFDAIQNAALVEEAAAAAEAMQEQARVLFEAVSVFKMEAGREGAQRALAAKGRNRIAPAAPGSGMLVYAGAVN